MKRFLVSLFLLLLLSGCSSFDTSEHKETSVTTSTSHSVEQDTGVDFQIFPDKQLVKVTNNSKKLVTINDSETFFLKLEGPTWVGDSENRGLLFMSHNLLPGETSENMIQVPFDTGTIKAVFSYTIDQEEYSKEIIFKK